MARREEEDPNGAVAELTRVAVRLTRQLLRHADREPADYLAWVPTDILAAAEDAEAGYDGEPPSPGFTLEVGDLRDKRCPACGADELMANTSYALSYEGARVVGGMAVCTACGESPYAAMTLP